MCVRRCFYIDEVSGVGVAGVKGHLHEAVIVQIVAFPGDREDELRGALVALEPIDVIDGELRQLDLDVGQPGQRAGEVTAAELDEKVTEKLKEAQPDVEMKGFRKGKVPMALLKKQFGPRLMGEAMQEAVDGAMQGHLDETGVDASERAFVESELRAPLDGLVISGDWTRSLGVPVSRGDLMFQIAPLDEYRVAVQVSDRDIAGSGVGQQARLTLSALPRESIRFTVLAISSIAPDEVAATRETALGEWLRALSR